MSTAPPLELAPPEDEPYEHVQRSPRDLAERALLGAMLRTQDARDQATLTVQSGDLHDVRYEQIYDAIVHLYSRGNPVDVLTVAHHLGNQLPAIGGHPELAQLYDDGLAVIDAGYYADLVADHAARARLDSAALAIHQLATGYGDTPTAELVDKAREHLERVPSAVPGVDQDQQHPWAPLDLAEALAGQDTGPRATLALRRDGKALLYPGAIHSIAGEPGSGKSWVAIISAAQELEQEHPVLYIDFEDRPHTLVARLRSLGVTDDQIKTGLRYIRPMVALTPDAWRHLQPALADTRLAVIDGITEAMTLHGLSLMDNEDVARFIALLPRRLADAGPAVLQVDHVVKNSEARGKYAIGGQHKLAAIDGCAYKMLVIKSFGRGAKGHAKIVIDKDRHGDIGPTGSTAADIHLDASDPSGAVYGWFASPEQSHDEDGHFRPTVLMGRVSEYLMGRPGPASLNEIKRGVKGNTHTIAEAVDALIREGNIRVEQGPNRTQTHHLITVFEDRS